MIEWAAFKIRARSIESIETYSRQISIQPTFLVSFTRASRVSRLARSRISPLSMSISTGRTIAIVMGTVVYIRPSLSRSSYPSHSKRTRSRTSRQPSTSPPMNTISSSPGSRTTNLYPHCLSRRSRVLGFTITSMPTTQIC